ncbi:hypothetical protein [Longimicrobium sp.]|uniref:hypothetical protein n=1 Tax=Longimicrobium sp. TaxID=2029185 RepID=UPI002D075DCE|nr:hypothetical protein [Longimicrobium sp.]HSU13003.1 hypothetical protein [Longimicrobium sp.]
MLRTSPKVHTTSFLRGFARALDLRGAVAPPYARPRASAGRRSDRAAVAHDWRMVWTDLDNAFSHVKLQGTATGDGHGTKAQER